MGQDEDVMKGKKWLVVGSWFPAIRFRSRESYCGKGREPKTKNQERASETRLCCFFLLFDPADANHQHPRHDHSENHGRDHLVLDCLGGRSKSDH